MTQESLLQNIVQTKTALAGKYERLARKRRSKPARATLLRHAKRFRDQAENAKKGIPK
jgi:hypothetical protein